MAYNKTIWTNRVTEKIRTFFKQDNPDGTISLTPDYGEIIEEGTPVTAANMNKIEQGIADAFTEIGKKVDKVNAVTSVAGKTGAVTLVKGDVGLGSVENYSISTTTEAQAGTSNVKYMTPLRVKEAIATLPGKPIFDFDFNSRFSRPTPEGTNSTSISNLGSQEITAQAVEYTYNIKSGYAITSIQNGRAYSLKVTKFAIGFNFPSSGTNVAEGRYGVKVGNKAEQLSPIRTFTYTSGNQTMEFPDTMTIPITTLGERITITIYGRKVSGGGMGTYIDVDVHYVISVYQL
ncbi:hypothetical protein KQI88_15985 [Alkaliphilus sp. MSJ-5]|uniref:Uncharacterized protein n=1 Tax=Alkaliphilus flagellatus TaxID=2841507 RepID=A0ABS6G603_9FIRM|nr:hypothetical protein [Alkaliphilus flagellatus]MBU5677918.1 hypothetical protein [Alkaliphilus flagellatus]